MVAEEPDDSIIRRRAFKISDSIELDDVIIPQKEEKSVETNTDVEIDEALGDFFDPFAESDENTPGAIGRDGTVKVAPDTDVIADLAKEGEKRVNWVLMIAMIFVFSGVSLQAGIALPPLLAITVLIGLAGLGFTLSELWVPKENLHLLGITWAIISMKILYGLAIELHRWEFISTTSLGPLLLGLVAVNVWVAYRHNHDAIAAQSTLILLAIGSSGGAILGEMGVAAMILIATLLVHGLALHRNSGNLAALGIATTNLWIGMHALTDGVSVGSLVILPLKTPLLLFLLLMTITCINATMAARFAREENWFSSAFKSIGLGKPGLWGVSISLGMVGAMLAVAANREDLGYALGLITFLCAAFAGSYLVVRGVGWQRVTKPLLIAIPLLTMILLLGEQFDFDLGIDSYELFTLLGSIITGYVILRDQDSVTDRVLWTGAIAILGLLVLLVPTESSDAGGDGGRLLLAILASLHIGTAYLAIKRNSPSLAGITVLLPWIWVLIEEVAEETIRTIFVANDINDPGSIINLEPIPLFFYLAISSVLLIIVNLRLGKTGVNLASQFLGLTEISASVRDSGLLQLWSLGLWLPMLTILFLARFGGFTAPTLLALLLILTAMHIGSEIFRKRVGRASTMLIIIAIFFFALQWQFGLAEPLMLIYCIMTMILLVRDGGVHQERYTMGMTLMAVQLLLLLSQRDIGIILPDMSSIPAFQSDQIALICTLIIVVSYLPQAPKMEKLLNPALASLFLLSTMVILSYKMGDSLIQFSSLGLFAGSTIWLVANGEVRHELKSIAARDVIRAQAKGSDGIKSLSESKGSLSNFDPRLAEMQAKRKKKREKGDAEDIEDLYLTDATHKPVIVSLVLILVLISATILSLLLGPQPIVLIGAGIFATILVSVARYRTQGLELELPHFAGMEMPVAIAISGLVVAHTAGHLGPGASNRELFDLAVLVILVFELGVVSLMSQKNILERLSIAIDWFILPILIGRLVGATLIEALPFPLTVNPFEGNLTEWRLPWFLLEAILILCVVGNAWINKKREELNKETSKTEGARTIAVVLLSFGPAGILSVIFSLNHVLKHKQTTDLGLLIPTGFISLIAISSWYDGLGEYIPNLTLWLGILIMISCALTIPYKGGDWTMVLAIDAHLLIFIGILSTGQLISIIMPLILIAMSTTIWIIGILEFRKIFRIWGLVDLLIAILASLLFLSPTILEPTTLLIALILLASELGLVSWLGLANEKELIKD